MTLEGLSFVDAKLINSDVAGRIDSLGVLSSIVVNNAVFGAPVLSQYSSSDGFLVLKLVPGAFGQFNGTSFSVSAFFANGSPPVTASIVRQSANL
jgi:hypothetical protein